MKLLLSLLLTLASLTVTKNTEAAMLWDFRTEYATWNASDIVVLSPSNHVIQVWKGSLQLGQEVMGPPLDSGPRAVFLVNPQPNRPPSLQTRWSGACIGQLNISTVWLKNDRAFALRQRGDENLELTDLGCDTSQFHAGINQILTVQYGLRRQLLAVQKGADPRGLLQYAFSGVSEAKKPAIGGLAKCGSRAVPSLRNLMNDPAHQSDLGWITDALRQAGGKAEIPNWIAIVQQETEYWVRRAPQLKEGWLHASGRTVSDLQFHHDKLCAVLQALYELRAKAADQPVRKLKAFWLAHPNLEPDNQFDKIGENCDRVLTVLQQDE